MLLLSPKCLPSPPPRMLLLQPSFHPFPPNFNTSSRHRFGSPAPTTSTNTTDWKFWQRGTQNLTHSINLWFVSLYTTFLMFL